MATETIDQAKQLASLESAAAESKTQAERYLPPKYMPTCDILECFTVICCPQTKQIPLNPARISRYNDERFDLQLFSKERLLELFKANSDDDISVEGHPWCETAFMPDAARMYDEHPTACTPSQSDFYSSKASLSDESPLTPIVAAILIQRALSDAAKYNVKLECFKIDATNEAGRRWQESENKLRAETITSEVDRIVDLVKKDESLYRDALAEIYRFANSPKTTKFMSADIAAHFDYHYLDIPAKAMLAEVPSTELSLFQEGEKKRLAEIAAAKEKAAAAAPKMEGGYSPFKSDEEFYAWNPKLRPKDKKARVIKA